MVHRRYGQGMNDHVFDSTAPGAPLHHHWSVCVGAGRAAEGLRAGWLEHLALAVRECGFRYVRFHGLFHDDMFVWNKVGEQVIYNWQYIDEVFDRMQALGVKPFVELGFCPGDLATQKGTVFWWKGNGSPPNDYVAWGALVEAFIRHCLARYGSDEVRSWYFEVWNEPNLHPFFKGTKSQYFELYAVSVSAIKGVDAHLRVGGPSTSNFVPDERFDGEVEDTSKQVTWKVDDLDSLAWKGVWVEDFLAFCKARCLPLDFISAHPYPTDWALDGHGQNKGRSRHRDAIVTDLAWLQRTIAASGYPHAEIHCTEWSSSPSPRDHAHDELPAAAYVVRSNLLGKGLVDSLSYWVFTDVFEESGAGTSVFHGGFGLINFQGIPKPTFHAYRFLHRLGDRLLHQEEGLTVTRHDHDATITAIFYHYPDEYAGSVAHAHARGEALALRMSGSPRRSALRLAGLPPGAVFTIETLDELSGHAVAAWAIMGYPEPPDRTQVRQLTTIAMSLRQRTVQATASGLLELELELSPWSIVLVDQIR